MGLDAGVEFDGCTELAGQVQVRVGMVAAFVTADFADAHGWNADVFGYPVLVDAQDS